jgi:hypothetical protein
VTALDASTRNALLRRGFALEYATLGWNVAGIVVLAVAAISAGSVALAGFGLDSLIEIGASTVVIWELSGTGQRRQRRALRLIGYAFAALASYLLAQSTLVLATGYHPRPSVLGMTWTAVTAAAMFALAAGKARTGRALGNPVLRTEGRVTLIEGIFAAAVLFGLALNAALGWWWADPPPAQCWSTTQSARYGRSSPTIINRARSSGRRRAGPRAQSVEKSPDLSTCSYHAAMGGSAGRGDGPVSGPVVMVPRVRAAGRRLAGRSVR